MKYDLRAEFDKGEWKFFNDWERCKSCTLRGAMKEAEKQYQAIGPGSVIVLAEVRPVRRVRRTIGWYGEIGWAGIARSGSRRNR